MSRKCQFPQFRLRIDTSDDLADGRVEVGCLDPADDEVFSLSCLDLDGDADPDGVEVVRLLDADGLQSGIEGCKQLSCILKMSALSCDERTALVARPPQERTPI